MITIQSGNTTKKVKVKVKKPTGYTITKTAGAYTDSVKTTVKVKKGYTVYYTTSAKFKKADKLAAKKSKTCEISGGTLIASGAAGMDVAPTSGSSQPVVNVKFSSTQAAGTYVVLKDAQGNVVMTAQPTKKFQSIVMSCEALTLGSTYTVYYGSSLESLTEETSFTFSSVSMTTGSSSSGGWNPGGPGGNQPGGRP